MHTHTHTPTQTTTMRNLARDLSGEQLVCGWGRVSDPFMNKFLTARLCVCVLRLLVPNWPAGSTCHSRLHSLVVRYTHGCARTLKYLFLK